MSHGESLNGYSSVVIVDRKFGEKGKIQTTILVVRLKMSEKRKLVEYLHFPLQTMFLLSIAFFPARSAHAGWWGDVSATRVASSTMSRRRRRDAPSHQPTLEPPSHSIRQLTALLLSLSDTPRWIRGTYVCTCGGLEMMAAASFSLSPKPVQLCLGSGKRNSSVLYSLFSPPSNGHKNSVF